MFKDEAKLVVKAGHGGIGCVSFRREKYVPFGGPDGGDGGKGGDVVLRAERGIKTLSVLKGKRLFKAGNGGNGTKRNKRGKDGQECLIELPLGTVVKEGSNILCDLNEEKDFVIARGGIGGKGNVHFASSSRQAPVYAQEGRVGEEKELFMELRLIADVGLVGFPNAGKSSLLSCLSKAYPKVASYPFTTLYPNLGVVYINEMEYYVMADIPGLVSGASKGVGLGIKFLKHIERTKVLLFLIDAFFSLDQFELLMNELMSYKESLSSKSYCIALNKMDLFYGEEKEKRINDFKNEYKKGKYFQDFVSVLGVSCVTGEGIDSLKKSLFRLIKGSS